MPGMATETVREIQIGRQIDEIQDPEFRSQIMRMRELIGKILTLIIIRVFFGFIVAWFASMLIAASYLSPPVIQLMVGLACFFFIWLAIDYCVRPIHLKLARATTEEIVRLGQTDPGYQRALLKISELDSTMAPRALQHYEMIADLEYRRKTNDQ